jgi:hypothetical protein
MITNTLTSKVATLAMLPALTLGLFATPALAMGADVTLINVDGGAGGDNDSSAGDGARGGDGGNARVDNDSRGDNTALAGDGSRGGNGGDTGDTGNGGNAGSGARGGDITTGDAIATAIISNDTNTTDTRITVEDCNDCDRYNEFYLEADRYYQEWSQDWRHEESCSVRPMRHTEREGTSESYMEEDEHLMMYSKTAVPEMTIVNVQNDNEALVLNLGRVEANSGENAALGGEGGTGGAGGDNDSTAGDGARGGDGGRAVVEDGGMKDIFVPVQSWHYPRHHHHYGSDDVAEGGDGARGGDGGNTGSAGTGGAGGNGAEGGSIDTGEADALAQVVNVTNRSVTRVTR